MYETKVKKVKKKILYYKKYYNNVGKYYQEK